MEGDAERIKTVNANVNIHHNKFIRIRDNPVEPEISAYNWWIHHNEIQNAHAWLSFTEMTGGEIYIFGNLGWNNEPYGIIGDHDEGTVLKFQNAEPFPSMPIYIFHNSWVVNEDYIRPKTPSRNIHHFNNAIFLKDKKSSTLTPRNYDRSYKFENDLISGKVSDFAKSKWKNLTIAEPMFLNITKGDFRLDKKSPAIDSGKKIKIGIWKSIFQGKSPDIGAYEGSVRIAGPEYTPK